VADGLHEPFSGRDLAGVGKGIVGRGGGESGDLDGERERQHHSRLRGDSRILRSGYWFENWGDAHVWTWEAFEGVEAQAGVFDEDGAIDLFSGFSLELCGKWDGHTASAALRHLSLETSSSSP
jgi:hypothetical protein